MNVLLNNKVSMVVAILWCFVGCISMRTTITEKPSSDYVAPSSSDVSTDSKRADDGLAVYSNLKQIHLLSMIYYQTFNSFPVTFLDLKKLDQSLIEGFDFGASVGHRGHTPAVDFASAAGSTGSGL